MIMIDTTKARIEAHAYGKLSLSDLQTLEQAANQNIPPRCSTDLLIDLRDAEGASLDALIEEWKFAHRHAQDFRKIAVLSKDNFLNIAACFSSIFFDAEVKDFDSEDEAIAWIEMNTAS